MESPKAHPLKSSADILTVSNFAHIDKVEVEFGDLTVLVGPQASGKSLVLQLLKLVLDGRAIKKTFEKYGLVVKGDKRFLARFLGQGMEGSWREDSKVTWGGRDVTLSGVSNSAKRGNPSVYFVPAHRTLTLSEGYPPTFQQFRPETPFVVRQFSEELRQVLIEGISRELLFPQAKRLKGKVRDKINEAIFHGAQLREDASGVERQLKLHFSEGVNLSYMTWTAGQREFIPLLLGLYYLLPAGGKAKRADIDWVIIEEPEMGLHPKAIMAIMLLILDLLSRGYKVILSTHSPLVLEVVWALNLMKQNKAKWPSVLKMFDIHDVSKASARGEVEMAESALKKNYKVHLFDFKDGLKVSSRDISSLDPSSEDPAISGWGGLTGMSGRIGEVVSELVASTPAD
jgi:energy-coupling factor transporter ATP-binding protein EcfA2